MKNADLFVQLSHALGDYDEASLLTLCLLLNADDEPLRTTLSILADRMLGGVSNRNRVARAAQRLADRGLLTTRVHPKTWTEYSVNGQAVAELLRKPLPDTRYLPGISQVPIPFLQRFNSASDETTQTGQGDRVEGPIAKPEPSTTEAQS